jgi:hypothetical protein
VRLLVADQVESLHDGVPGAALPGRLRDRVGQHVTGDRAGRPVLGPVAQRPGQLDDPLEEAGARGHPRRAQGAALPVGPVRAQLGRSDQGAGGLGVRPSPMGPVGDLGQRRGDRLVGHDGGLGQVPDPAVRVVVVRPGQLPVGRDPVLGGAQLIGRRADQRMLEPHHPAGDRDQPGGLGRRQVAQQRPRFPHPADGPQVAVAGRGQQQRRPRAGRQRAEAGGEGQLDRGGLGVRGGRPAQLQQRQRVAGRPVQDLRQGRAGQIDPGLPQQPGRVVLVERRQRDDRQPGQGRRDLVVPAGGQERDVRAAQAAGHEAEHRQGRLVAPLGVVDDDQKRSGLRLGLQPGQHVESQPQRVRRLAGDRRQQLIVGDQVGQGGVGEVAVAQGAGGGQGPSTGLPHRLQNGGLAGARDAGQQGGGAGAAQQGRHLAQRVLSADEHPAILGTGARCGALRRGRIVEPPVRGFRIWT